MCLNYYGRWFDYWVDNKEGGRDVEHNCMQTKKTLKKKCGNVMVMARSSKIEVSSFFILPNKGFNVTVVF